ncbi:MAG: hypothetical protein JOZ69_25895 [Myxococcales bacterium]|nr:hypothetical protein [Myxococcales bacterium]
MTRLSTMSADPRRRLAGRAARRQGRGRALRLCSMTLGASVVVMAALEACGGGSSSTSAAAAPTDVRKWPADDRSLCQVTVHWKNNPQLEVNETVGPGSPRPNIRRVLKTVGDRDNRHSVLLCREIDTNLDGIKDLARVFNEKGEPLHEEADTNFDGKLDHWINFADGRIEEEDVDTTLSTGRPNVWKFYVNGELSRIRRNTHCPNGKADTWEIYYRNRLERVGNDTSCDGHVDRWDRDSQLMAQEEQQAGGGVEVADAGARPVTVGPNGELLDGGIDGAAAAQALSADGGRAKRPGI